MKDDTVWAQQMIDKYNPNVYIIEPVTEFYDNMVNKFSDNNKVHLMNVGVGIKNCDGFIHLNGDGTSSSLTNGKSISVKFKTIETILNIWSVGDIDLLQMNIEGDEYQILEYMLETGIINNFKNIQIQFHLGIYNAIERRNEIRERLELNGFKIKFDYPFIWESWCKIR